MHIPVTMAKNSTIQPILAIFENPMALSLEKVYLNIRGPIGASQQIKALDPFWADRKFFPTYHAIPKHLNEETTEQWCVRAHNCIVALKFLYQLPFYKFWSYIVFEPAAHAILESFLQNAVPPVLNQPTGVIQQPYTKIYDMVFRIYSRICNMKESETEYITPQAVANLLKGNIINNCVLWDLTRLYGHIDDDGYLSQIIKTALDIVPSLKDELHLTVTFIADIFESIGTTAYENDTPTEQTVNQLTVLLHEAAFTVHRFIQVCPDFKQICITEHLFSRIVHTYGSECPILYKLMESVLIDENHPSFDRVDNARVELLQICHQLTTFCMDKVLETQTEMEKQHKWSEIYLGLILTSIDQKDFVVDFNKCFPISQDVDTLQAICLTVDKDRCNNILSALKSLELEAELPPVQPVPEVQNGLEEATVPEDIMLESKITELQDMFPDLGDGFLEQCLLRMKLDTQAVIMAILEGELPPELATMDQTMPRIPAEETPEEELVKNTKLAYVGKKPDEHENFAQLLDDKSHIKQQRERFVAYSLITDDIYDDDYDDSYEECPAIVVERDDMEKMPRARTHGGRKSDSEESEEEIEEAVDVAAPRGDAFCEDPAIVRARREAKYQQRQPAKTRDVIGKPKGQGQDKTVLHNRDNKNAHKSAKGNHNRRSGAQWKRGRGMIPS